MKVEISNLTFSYANGHTAVSEITFGADEPGFLVITGPSGCGKSTLLRLMMGTPWLLASGKRSGVLRIDGKDPAEAIAEGRVSYMAQDESLFPNLTLLDNLCLPFRIKRQATPPLLAELIELASLGDYLRYFPYQLSGGTRKRAELARAFLTQPALVLLDEPFSKQDLRLKTFLYQYLLRFQSLSGAMIILVTHDLMEAVLIANRIIVMNGSGRIAKELLIDKPLPRILDAHGVEKISHEFAELRSIILEEPITI